SCDDISDIDYNDVPEQLEKTLRQSVHDSRSLFNLNLAECESTLLPTQSTINTFACSFSVLEPSTQVDEVEKYKEQADQQQQEWIAFIVAATKQGPAQASQEVKCAPSEEQQLYLKQGPNLQNFIRGSVAFMSNAARFLKEIDEPLELQASLLERIQYRMDDRVSNAIHQNLASNQ
ncbi:hypothetical protein KR009_012369, partial [Drosophila setifemur]